MPATSDKQKRFMDAAAHNPAFAKKAGVPVSVAKDFSKASKGVKFGASGSRADSQVVNRSDTNHGKNALFSKGGTMATKKLPPFMGKETKAEEAKEKKIKAISPQMYKKGEKAEGIHKMAKGGGVESKGKTKGTMIKMGAAKPLGMKRGGKC